MNRIRTIGIASLFILVGFIGLINFGSEGQIVGNTTLYVGGIGSGNYTSIQSAIDAANQGDTIFVFDDSAPYYENIVINKSINLIGQNKNTTIINGGNNGSAIKVTANWVNITGFTVTNGEKNRYYYEIKNAGIKLVSVAKCTIIGNNISSNNGFGIYLNSSSENMIIDNILSNNSNGLSLATSTNNLIRENNLTLNLGSGISLWISPNNNMTNNNVTNNGDGIIISVLSNDNTLVANIIARNDYRGISITSSSNIKIIDNNLIDDGIFVYGDLPADYNSHTISDTNLVNGKPIYYFKNSNGLIIDNIPVGQLILANCSNFNLESLQINDTDIGINIAYSNNITTTNTNLINNKWGIIVKYSSYNTIMNNNISSNEVGIWFSKLSNDNTLRNNIFLNNLRAVGIDETENNYFIGNNFSNNFEGIMMFYYSKNNRIIDNTFFNCGESLTIYQSSNNDIISNKFLNNIVGPALIESLNSIVSNNEILNNNWGIYIDWKSSNNIISSNNISNNKYMGIDINSSFDNRIYHNNFINNGNQSFDDGDDNFWDNGYPSGGNYWSDYTGTDADGGGIGDTPYIIDDYNKDNYPLMEPWGIITEESKNIMISLKLDKTEFYIGEPIIGSIQIQNNYPYQIFLNDELFLTISGFINPGELGINFKVVFIETSQEFEGFYNYPDQITIEAQSALTIEFELNQFNELINESVNENSTTLEVGDYSIYTYFYYGESAMYEIIISNHVNFKIIDKSLAFVDNDGSETDKGNLQSIILTSFGGLILSIFLISIFIIYTEIGKYKFLSMFIAPLYARASRKRRKKYQDGYVRGYINGYIRGNPGESYNKIKRILTLPNGTLAYHLKILEQKGEIFAERDGLYKRFYPSDGRIAEDVLELTKFQRRIYNLIDQNPGISQTEISNHLQESVQRINYNIQMMIDARIIKLQREGTKTKCYLIDQIS